MHVEVILDENLYCSFGFMFVYVAEVIQFISQILLGEFVVSLHVRFRVNSIVVAVEKGRTQA